MLLVIYREKVWFFFSSFFSPLGGVVVRVYRERPVYRGLEGGRGGDWEKDGRSEDEN